MKQLFAFSILFCLVFLNVPRSFVHNCEHQNHQTDKHNHQHDSDSVLSFEVDQDHCFVCEFDLGFFNVVETNIHSFAAFLYYTFNEPSVEYINPDEFSAFSHRGPPTV